MREGSTRNFFTKGGQPESVEQQRRRLEREKTDFDSYRATFREDEKGREQLEKINWDILKNILEQYLEKAGLPKESINFIPKEKTLSVPNSHIRFLGKYDRQDNVILINYEFIKNFSENSEQKLNPEIDFLLTLIHEEIHAISKQECYGAEDGKLSNGVEIVSGYLTLKDGSIAFHALDEGMTEKMAREALLDYVRATGHFQIKECVDFFEKYQNEYNANIECIDELIERISIFTGVSPDVVWGGFIRGKFEGEDFTDLTLKEGLVQIFSEGFLNQIQGISGSQLLNEIKSYPKPTHNSHV